jgi:hypothetical protein
MVTGLSSTLLDPLQPRLIVALDATWKSSPEAHTLSLGPTIFLAGMPQLRSDATGTLPVGSGELQVEAGVEHD